MARPRIGEVQGARSCRKALGWLTRGHGSQGKHLNGGKSCVGTQYGRARMEDGPKAKPGTMYVVPELASGHFQSHVGIPVPGCPLTRGPRMCWAGL